MEPFERQPQWLVNKVFKRTSIIYLFIYSLIQTTKIHKLQL